MIFKIVKYGFGLLLLSLLLALIYSFGHAYLLKVKANIHDPLQKGLFNILYKIMEISYWFWVDFLKTIGAIKEVYVTKPGQTSKTIIQKIVNKTCTCYCS